MSQSGALGIAVITWPRRSASACPRSCRSATRRRVRQRPALLLGHGPRTEVVLLYLESFGNPRRFADLARRIGRRKPIVVVKSGRSQAGRRAASSHTGALLAASDNAVDALLARVGVIRTDTLEEMFDVATLLANQPIPKGRNVAILTNAGGLAIQCADTCEARGLSVAALTEATVEKLRSFLPPAAGVSNPVDMIASATGDDYSRAIATIAADRGSTR